MRDRLAEMRDRLTTLSSKELLEITERKFNEYTPEALRIVKDEIEKRGGIQNCKFLLLFLVTK